jgi:hypothetical protein
VITRVSALSKASQCPDGRQGQLLPQKKAAAKRFEGSSYCANGEAVIAFPLRSNSPADRDCIGGQNKKSHRQEIDLLLRHLIAEPTPTSAADRASTPPIFFKLGERTLDRREPVGVSKNSKATAVRSQNR